MDKKMIFCTIGVLINIFPIDAIQATPRQVGDSCIAQRYSTYFWQIDTTMTFELMYDYSLMQVADESKYSLNLDNVEIPVMSNCFYSNLDSILKFISRVDLRTKLNLLLKFTQSIPYKDDREIYGEDRILIPEMFLYKFRGDCDDKAIFFCYLVKKLLNMECILIGYIEDRHICCAVQMAPGTEDHYIEYQGKKYVFAEPTGRYYFLGSLYEELRGHKYIVREMAILK